MRIARHPVYNRRIDTGQYVKEFGHRAIDRRDRDNRPEAVCPFCGAGLYLAAEGTKRTPHFKHHEGADCPSQEPAGRPYLPLPPTRPDPEAGARLRAAFRRNWRRHFAAVNRLVPYLSPEEFVRLIEIATANRIWDYVDFPEADIPYSFVLLADFPPWTSLRRGGEPERRYWFRYWYSPNVRSIDSLWIEPTNRVVLYRASFEPPRRRNGRPDYDDMVDYYSVPIDRHFLEGDEPRILGFIERHIEDWFAASPTFN